MIYSIHYILSAELKIIIKMFREKKKRYKIFFSLFYFIFLWASVVRFEVYFIFLHFSLFRSFTSNVSKNNNYQHGIV